MAVKLNTIKLILNMSSEILLFGSADFWDQISNIFGKVSK